MKILVIGGGGREHAMAWSLTAARADVTLVCAPGNPGIAQLAKCVPADLTRPDELVAIADREEVDLTVVGPELPLSAGVADAFAAASRPIVGPTRAAAALESSKSFAKHFMARHGVPTARFADCATSNEAFDGDRARRARLSGCRESRRSRRGQRRRDCRGPRDGRGGGARGDGRSPVWRRRRSRRARRVPRRTGGVVLRAVGRPIVRAHVVGPGSQAHLRRRPRPEHRRDGRVRAEPADHRRGRGARDQRGGRARAGWHARRG